MGMAAVRLSLPISWAAWARWLSRSTSLRSISSIFSRQSPMCMVMTGSAGVGGTASHGRQLLYKFCHRRGFPAGIPLNGFHDSTSDDGCVGIRADGGELFWSGDAEADGDGKAGEAAEPAHQGLGIFGKLLLNPGDSGAGHGIDEA